MSESQVRRILLGVTGWIDAYKIVELVRRMIECGVEVGVVMSRDAHQFVPELTHHAVFRQLVRISLCEDGDAAQAGTRLLDFSHQADLVLIAPATAGVIAQLAQGFTQDFLTTIALTTPAPLVLAPSMDQQIWTNPATQANVSALRARGVRILGMNIAGPGQPADEQPVGRMLEPSEIVSRLLAPKRTSGAPTSLRPVTSPGTLRRSDGTGAAHPERRLRLVSGAERHRPLQGGDAQ